MESNKFREQFFEKSKQDLKDVNMDKVFYLIEKAVKTENKKMLDYENIVSIGAENKGERIDEEQYTNLLCKVYKIWWSQWLIPAYKNAPEYRKEELKSIIDDKEMDPNNKDLQKDILDIMSYVDCKNIYQMAWYMQEDYFCLLDMKNFFYTGQPHARICETRLYLNFKLKDIPKATDELVRTAFKKKVPLLFKFALYDKRNDNFVIYTDYQNIDKVVDVIEQTKKENPDLFADCKVKNPLMATYKDYMGFGEEPVFGSYNSIRVDILTNLYDELLKEYKMDKNSLTKENMQNKLKDTCKYFHIDSENFCKNKCEEYKQEYEK